MHKHTNCFFNADQISQISHNIMENTTSMLQKIADHNYTYVSECIEAITNGYKNLKNDFSKENMEAIKSANIQALSSIAQSTVRYSTNMYNDCKEIVEKSINEAHHKESCSNSAKRNECCS